MNKALKRVLVHAGILCCAVAVALLVAEIAVRIYDGRVKKTPFLLSSADFYDKTLGWKGKAAFGDLSSGKPKIFLVGDSFTYGYGAPEGGALYHEEIGRRLGAEMFVYGGVGYGTLQEYLVIDRYLDRIKPDLVLIQAHPNDLINNSWELERRSYYSNNQKVRPYQKDGRIVYKYPRSHGGLTAAFSRSRLVSFLQLRIEKKIAEMAKKGALRSVEFDIAEKGMEMREFRDAVATTGAIVKKIKGRAGGVTVAAFAASDARPYFEQLKEIFSANGVAFIEEVPETLHQRSEDGRELFVDGAHWNEEGHRIVGQVLADEIRNRGLLKTARP